MQRGTRHPSQTMIAVSAAPSGVRLSVHGPLDERANELLTEVARAALLTVKRANRIHLDLHDVAPPPASMPRIVRRLLRAGATLTAPPGGDESSKNRSVGAGVPS